MVEISHPQSNQDVRDVVAWAVAASKTLEIVGGGSKRNFGKPVRADHLVSLASLSGITNYEPEELILTAKAATPLEEIEKALAERGQMLAFEPPKWTSYLEASGKSVTLGGILACNLSGPRRVKAGAARDHFLGVEAVSGRAEIFKAGGRVVKNVTGYDMCKLLAGSYGTLAIMTEVTLKVLPAPETARTIVVTELNLVEACRAMSKLLQSPLEISAACHVPAKMANALAATAFGRDDQALTVFRLEGAEPSVSARLTGATSLLTSFGSTTGIDLDASDRFWSNIRDLKYFRSSETSALLRIAIAPAGVARFISEIEEHQYFDYVLDWGGGLVWIQISESTADNIKYLREASRFCGGQTTVVHASENLRAQCEVFEPIPEALDALNRRIKSGFDPHGVLNPGKLRQDL